MKIMKTLAALMLASVFMVACGDKQQQPTTPPPANNPTGSGPDMNKQNMPDGTAKPDQGDPCHSM